MSASLLVELLTEELPPKALRTLEAAFADGLTTMLSKLNLLDASSKTRAFSTPRRLAVRIEGVRAVAPDEPFSEKLMPVAIGMKDGAPTPALLKKLAAKQLAHVDPLSLAREHDGKTEQLVYRAVANGQPLAAGLQTALDEAIERLPIPKIMRYQLADGTTTVRFVRPARRLLALHGTAVIDVHALGLHAGRITQGHRFQGVREIDVPSADAYEDSLAAHGHVIASFNERRSEIARQLHAAATAAQASLGDEQAVSTLLDEVTALVEQPAVYAGRFDAEFLSVPPECLTLTMRANQKYFPLFDVAGTLTNRFLIVSNMQVADPSHIIAGNERVIRPRLADAHFFFAQDRKKPLASRVAALDRVVYHAKLGSQEARTQRVVRTAGLLAAGIGAEVAEAEHAALLAKADLTTDMVGEFPELQGTMGRYYALADGESENVAFAIEDHYRPRFAGDALPRSGVGVAVALADKAETLVGLFSIGEKPTGDKDPYGLRRQAFGIVRLLAENHLPLSIAEVLKAAAQQFGAAVSSTDALLFTAERARSYYVDQGIPQGVVNAVLNFTVAGDTPLRALEPVMRSAFWKSAEGRHLAAANKRIRNILRKSSEDVTLGTKPSSLDPVDPALFQEPAERDLSTALTTVGEHSLALREEQKLVESLEALAPLSAPVAAFFDRVLVNAEDPAVRRNRLTLLKHASAYMNQFADLSLMAE